ncbi:serine/threonine-protein kinase [Cryptosporangium aurantiacum]|uniref:non-specific serine/threonine protein kinase n=1 Tax=Cryptosporangium aurantiacum TaxID=134849 RepID=A0A1M7RD18_9ACTN|nr:serine/threonine-protein kinase [Cryptosporangium aurantiacum]SHN44104.1 Serine/threonine protein kinase [Cryptosporangium aurantiacum]
MTDAANSQLVGGRYRLGPHLGTGGMGTVWRATDELLHRDVAIKEVPIPHGLPASEAERLRERYLREARAAARLRHAGVVGVYDVLPEIDRVWIVMEYVEARNLADVIRADGPMTPERTATLGLQLLDALDHAHRAGVLHRDVKPANVLVCAGEHGERAVLTDFGVASVSGDASLTRTGHLVGSPAYLSPERLTGGTVGSPSDLWSLGCTLFAAVEGKAPFARDEQFAVITAITLEPVPPALRAGNLTPVLAGLLDKDPDQRWDAVRTRAALRRVADGLPVESMSETTWGTPPADAEPPAWWNPAAPSEPTSTTPQEYGLDPGPQVDWARASMPLVPDLSGPRPVSGSPGLAPASGGTPPPHPYGAVSAPPAPPVPPPTEQQGSKLGLWLLAAVLVVLLAGAAGVVAKKQGWLDLSASSANGTPSASATPTPSTSTSAPPQGNEYGRDQYSLRYPPTWNVYCMDDPEEIEKQGHDGCFFDHLTPAQHTDDNTVLRRSPYVLVIVDEASGSAREQLEKEDAAAGSSFPEYTRVSLEDQKYGDHQGVVLEFTYTGVVVDQNHRVRIFRFVQDGKYYEVSLRAPETSYADFLPGFEQIAGSLTPK